MDSEVKMHTAIPCSKDNCELQDLCPFNYWQLIRSETLNGRTVCTYYCLGRGYFSRQMEEKCVNCRK